MEEDFFQLFDFNLPEERVAKFPRHSRDRANLLVCLKNQPPLLEKFFQILNFIHQDDLLIYNDTRVECRRVFLIDESSGRRFESIFLKAKDNDLTCFEVLLRQSRKLKNNSRLFAEKNNSYCFQLEKTARSQCFLHSNFPLSAEVFSEIGQIPIPPYFKREEIEQDRTSYQSVFAAQGASIAAPTASLHFSDYLFKQAREKCKVLPVTLNIGYGTFAKVDVTNLSEKKLHSEDFQVTAATIQELAQRQYRKLWVIGTTALRVVETLWRNCDGNFNKYNGLSQNGSIDSFYFPPTQIQSADFLVTNFHLPRSSLLMLVCCMQPAVKVLSHYQIAIEKQLDFFSYGDAMLIENEFKS